jgi:hypothetical protein
LLAVLKPKFEDLAISKAAAEVVCGDASLANLSAAVRLLKRETTNAAITSSISASRLCRQPQR